MGKRYFCPVCKANRTRFQVIFKLGQEITKDPKSGENIYESDEWEAITVGSRPDLDVKCLSCDYTAPESLFLRAAENDQMYAGL